MIDELLAIRRLTDLAIHCWGQIFFREEEMYIRRSIHEQLTDEKRQFFNFKLTKNVSDFISFILQITTVILTPSKATSVNSEYYPNFAFLYRIRMLIVEC
jgi:hypothetical protein